MRTLTFEASLSVDAGASTAHVRFTLVCILTLMRLGIIFESFGALATEGTVGIDAGASLAQSSHDLALVDISAVGRETSLGAVAHASWTLLAGGSPALTDCGAAVELGAHDTLDLVDAGVVDAGQEAGSLAVIAFATHSGESVHTSTASWGDATATVQTTRTADGLSAVGSSVAIGTLTLVVDAFSSVHAANGALLFSALHVTGRLQLAVFAQTGVGRLAQTATASALVAQGSKAHLSGVRERPSGAAEGGALLTTHVGSCQVDSHSSRSSRAVTISHAAMVIHLGDGSPPAKGLVHRFHRLLGLDEDDLEKDSKDGALMKLHHGAALIITVHVKNK